MKCLAPLTVLNPKHKVRPLAEPLRVNVPCGTCQNCLKSMVSQWAFRLEYHARNYNYLDFVTLTFSPEYVPLTKSGLQNLEKRPLQLFLKRLRKLNGDKISYFACGEYGGRSSRPHYHILLYGCLSHSYIYESWSMDGNPIGNVHLGNNIHNGAIPYTLKYMHKKGQIPAFKGDDRTPEFRLMSKKIGMTYLSPAKMRWHLADWPNRQYVTHQTGHKSNLPRYFKEKILEYAEKNKIEYQQDRDWKYSYLSRDDKDYRSLDSRVQRIKDVQNSYNENLEQYNRNKI